MLVTLKTAKRRHGVVSDSPPCAEYLTGACMISFQYYYDASEAEAWMSEQELNMMGDERGKDEASASAMLKKHETLEAAIADYSETVSELRDTAKGLVDSEHPERYNDSFPPPLSPFLTAFPTPGGGKVRKLSVGSFVSTE